MYVNSHRAGGGRNRPHPVTRHRNTGGCSERVAHFFCGLHNPLWLCRAHYVLARISRKCRCAECEREHDTCASNRRTEQATKPVSYSHAVNVIPFRILRKLIQRLFKTKKRQFQHCELFTGGFPQQSSGHDSQITLSSPASKHFFYVAFGARLGEDGRHLPCNACAASFDSASDYEIGSFTYVYFAKRDQLKTVRYGMHH